MYDLLRVSVIDRCLLGSEGANAGIELLVAHIVVRLSRY